MRLKYLLALNLSLSLLGTSSSSAFSLPITEDSSPFILEIKEVEHSELDNFLISNEILAYTDVSKFLEESEKQYTDAQSIIAQEQERREAYIQNQEEYLKEIASMEENILKEQAERVRIAQEEAEKRALQSNTLNIQSSAHTSSTIGTVDGVTGSADGPITVNSSRNPYTIEPESGKVSYVVK